MDSIIESIRTLLRHTSDGGQLSWTPKKVYYGKNDITNQSNYPCIEVIPQNTVSRIIGTNLMQNTDFTIQVVVKDTKKAFAKDTDKESETFGGLKSLVLKMEEREADGRTLRNGTVMKTLIDNLKLGNRSDFQDDFFVEYEEVEQNGSYILTASFSFVVKALTCL